MLPRHSVMYSDTQSFNLTNFKSLVTIWYAIIQLILIIAMGAALVTANYSDILTYKASHYLMGQALFWLLSFILYFVYVSKHHSLKIRGHFVFFEKMQTLALALVMIPSFYSSWLAFLMGIVSEFNIVRDAVLQCIISMSLLMEVFLEAVTLIDYVVAVNKFNQMKPVPDVEQYEYLLPCDSRSATEIGYRLEGEAVADLLEKQADLLCYFKSAIVDLKNRVGELTSAHC